MVDRDTARGDGPSLAALGLAAVASVVSCALVAGGISADAGGAAVFTFPVVVLVVTLADPSLLGLRPSPNLAGVSLGAVAASVLLITTILIDDSTSSDAWRASIVPFGLSAALLVGGMQQAFGRGNVRPVGVRAFAVGVASALVVLTLALVVRGLLMNSLE